MEDAGDVLVRRVPPDACTLSGELDTPAQPVPLLQLYPLHAALTESNKCYDFL